MDKLTPGNWATWKHFAWVNPPCDAENWALWYTHDCLSTISAISNAFTIDMVMTPYVKGGDTQIIERGNEVEWARGFAVRMLDANGAPTQAGRVANDLIDQINEFGLLNESDYTERAQAIAIENIGRIIDLLKPNFVMTYPLWQTEDIVEDIYAILEQHYPSELNDPDDTGAWPQEGVICDILVEYGYWQDQEEEGNDGN